MNRKRKKDKVITVSPFILCSRIKQRHIEPVYLSDQKSKKKETKVLRTSEWKKRFYVILFCYYYNK